MRSFSISLFNTVPFVCLLLSVLVSPCTGLFHSNQETQHDVNGNLMDQHDGNLLEVGGVWYWFGMGYTDCKLEKGWIPPLDCPGIYRKFGTGCGFRTDHLLNLYTSTDLENWEPAGDAFPIDGRPEGIYFRPKVVFNEMTSKFVLWINYLPPARTPLAAYPNATYLVAQSDTAEGPFEVVNDQPGLMYEGAGDATLAVDKDTGEAFIAYDAWSNGHRISVERLTPDYLKSTGEETNSGFLSEKKHEAPLLFQRDDTWYLMYGHTCCFCRFGSGLQVYTAKSPLGPWTDEKTDVNQRVKLSGKHVIPAQANYVFEVDGKFIYTGDLWTSAPDGLKSHDVQYWGELKFNDEGKVQVMEFVDELRL
ncbi:hypothetical protein TrVE_jg12855 [Triparma verrucosa]|uniref:Uncharacterized protein n=2 Tax=Triparma TaxID=722752 RepID=A0A9W7F0Y5_9STRA|nr:hypothetical protein TrST_g8318 [Triparma strigata]GMI05695.1 hypothetical protein TrVE_jg12855 [Triparma verrucosa]